MSMFDDSKEDLDELKPLIGKKVVGLELRKWDYGEKRWIIGEGNVTLIFEDGTRIQGTEGEYGTNNIRILPEKK